MGANERIPVTVVCGYLGAGKTTLINHLLTDPGDRSIAVIVNDMGEVNVDADLIARENREEGIVDLSNGCICCRLSDDLLTEANRLAEKREFDVLVVEASGISEPIPIARTLLGVEGDVERTPPERFELDTMVSVLDSYGFWKEFDPEERSQTEDGERPLSAILMDQIEFCDVLMLNKVDMIPDDAVDEIERTVRELQPRAHIERTVYSEVDPELLLDTGRFDFEDARTSQGWKRRLQSDHDHSGAEHDHDEHAGHDHDHSPAARHGVTSFVYREQRPLHPERFAAWLDDWDGNIVRAKGICHIAGRDEEVIGLSQAGPSVEAGPIGTWDPDRDDPRTELVFIGHDMDEERIRSELDRTLVESTTDREWNPETDPFPL